MALTRRSFSILSSLLPVAGLASQAAHAQDVKGEGGKLRVASFPGGNDYPFWAIARLGLDRKYGFELENISVQPGGAALTAFRSGAVEGGLMNWLELARVRTAGEEIAAIVPFLEMPNVWVVPKSSPAKTVADLKGKKVGTYNRFSPEWVLYLATAKAKFGYDPRTESTIQDAGPGLLRGLMDQKQLDAAFIFYNLAMPMVASGEYRILFNSKDLLKLQGMPSSTMLTSVAFREAYSRSNPKNVRAFAMAYRDAVEYLRANDPIWVECLARQNITDAAVVPLMRDYSREVTMAHFSADPMAETRQLFDVLYTTGGKEAMGVDTLPTGIFNTTFSG